MTMFCSRGNWRKQISVPYSFFDLKNRPHFLLSFPNFCLFGSFVYIHLDNFIYRFKHNNINHRLDFKSTELIDFSLLLRLKS